MGIQFREVIVGLTLILSDFRSDGMFESDELERGSLELFRKEIALYLCKSVSEETYGKNCRDAWLVEPAGREALVSRVLLIHLAGAWPT